MNIGGDEIQKESFAYVNKNGKVPCSEVVVTGPGMLNCDLIAHTVGKLFPLMYSLLAYAPHI